MGVSFSTMYSANARYSQRHRRVSPGDPDQGGHNVAASAVGGAAKMAQGGDGDDPN